MGRITKSGTILIASIILLIGCKEYEPENGDIIFQTSLSNQSKAIQLATNSPYSHMGIVYSGNGKWYVYEASRIVKLTPLKEWVDRGKNKKFVVKRLIKYNEIMTKATLNKMLKYGEKFEGKPYDLYFEWSDERIYCSELVWKIYNFSTGLKVGELKKLKDFDLSRAEVIEKIKERYGNNIPKDENVISPESMFKSKHLNTVYEN